MRGSMRAHAVEIAAGVLSLFAMARPVEAHALGAECTLHGDSVRLEAYFDDDTAAADARVVVRDEARNIVAEGRTDSKGVWSFAAPPPGPYRVTVDAGAGHQTTIPLRIPSKTEQMRTVPSAAELAHEGPTRVEFTRFPWGGVALGLTVIVLLFLGWRGLRRWRRRCRSTPRATSISASGRNLEKRHATP
ncbi:MAG TPA: carboxypeptidase-like regulatory domain-containing protein [Gemmataceae bacterium]|nr:carboxypeptidase-like regulatory domain-containing protein [Gemmataceae bacterium]